ncbi:hypothetical protein [Pulveribacter sp.]|uniref:hypothetical protein n=1 Tax=Pulveribacter sp. TaxID=2678893 RepID=UPI0028A9C065|nr:hypothetical protein [Pulveribacter sp.]
MLSADRFPRNQTYGRTFDSLQLLQYREIGATFNCRRPVRQRLDRHKSIPCLATSSAWLAGGGQLLPRIPAARAGLRLDATWHAWEARSHGCGTPARTAWPGSRPPRRAMAC